MHRKPYTPQTPRVQTLLRSAANLAVLMRPRDTPREPRAWERAGYSDPDAYELLEVDPWADMPSDWSDGTADEIDSLDDDEFDEMAEVYALETSFYRDAA